MCQRKGLISKGKIIQVEMNHEFAPHNLKVSNWCFPHHSKVSWGCAEPERELSVAIETTLPFKTQVTIWLSTFVHININMAAGT
jgi:hypothetical protein